MWEQVCNLPVLGMLQTCPHRPDRRANMGILSLILVLAADPPADSLAKKMLPIYVKEVEAYSLAVACWSMLSPATTRSAWSPVMTQPKARSMMLRALAWKSGPSQVLTQSEMTIAA